jgi:hypothetical protein
VDLRVKENGRRLPIRDQAGARFLESNRARVRPASRAPRWADAPLPAARGPETSLPTSWRLLTGTHFDPRLALPPSGLWHPALLATPQRTAAPRAQPQCPERLSRQRERRRRDPGAQLRPSAASAYQDEMTKVTAMFRGPSRYRRTAGSPTLGRQGGKWVFLWCSAGADYRPTPAAEGTDLRAGLDA